MQVPRQMAQGRGARDVACGHLTMAGGHRLLIGINRSVHGRAMRVTTEAQTLLVPCARTAWREIVSKSSARPHGEEKCACAVLPSRDPVTSISYIVSAVQINDRNVK